MRVVHVITRLIVGGAQENTITSVLGLRKKPGLEVSLISGPTSGPEGTLEPLIQGIPNLLTVIPELVRPIHPLKDLVAFRKLLGAFRESRPDIVHTHSGKAGIIGRLAAYRAGVPVILHSIHGPSFGPFQGNLSNFIFRNAERWAGRVTTHFISVANAMTDQYLAAGIGHQNDYTRIFSGFPLQPFLTAENDPKLRMRFGIQPTDFVIGKVARLFRLKGHDDLFDAAPAIVQRHRNVRFLIVGGGEWRERFQNRVRELGLAEHFIFTGLVPPESVPSLIGIMDVLVHLSRREGLARTLPQALAAQKPVVAFDCDGAREVCITGKTGFLIPPGDVRQVAERINELIENPSLRQNLGSYGQEFVKKWFSVERLVDEQHKLYLELVGKKQ